MFILCEKFGLIPLIVNKVAKEYLSKNDPVIILNSVDFLINNFQKNKPYITLTEKMYDTLFRAFKHNKVNITKKHCIDNPFFLEMQKRKIFPISQGPMEFSQIELFYLARLEDFLEKNGITCVAIKDRLIECQEALVKMMEELSKL